MIRLRLTRCTALLLFVGLNVSVVHAQGANMFFLNKTVTFGFVDDGKSSTRMLVISNFDTVLSAHGHIGAPSMSVFALVGSDTFSIGPRTNDTIYFSFTPVDLSTLRDSVWITHDGKIGFGTTNPQKIVLTGQGLSANDTSARVQLGGFGITKITWKNQVDTTVIQPFSFRNVSDTSIRHLYGTFTGIQAPFAFATGSSPTFDVGDSAWDTVHFSFSPTTLGVFYDTLQMLSNANAPSNKILIYLTGTAIAKNGDSPNGELSTNNINFLSDSVGVLLTQSTYLHSFDTSGLQLHVTFGHTPAPPFTFSGQAISLDTGKVDTLTFTFNPTAGRMFKDSLIILTNASPPANHMRIDLIGTGLSSGVFRSASPEGLKLVAFTNPGSESIDIRMTLPQAGNATLTLYDESGVESATIFSGIVTAADQLIQYSAHGLADGIYFLRLESREGTTVAKLLVQH